MWSCYWLVLARGPVGDGATLPTLCMSWGVLLWTNFHRIAWAEQTYWCLNMWGVSQAPLLSSFHWKERVCVLWDCSGMWNKVWEGGEKKNREITPGSDGQLSGTAERGVSSGDVVALSSTLKDGVRNLLIINFLTRFLATFASGPSWKGYENIFSRGILSLPISDRKWENILWRASENVPVNWIYNRRKIQGHSREKFIFLFKPVHPMLHTRSSESYRKKSWRKLSRPWGHLINLLAPSELFLLARCLVFCQSSFKQPRQWAFRFFPETQQ